MRHPISLKNFVKIREKRLDLSAKLFRLFQWAMTNIIFKIPQ